MITARRPSTTSYGLAIGAAGLLLLAVAGCRGEHSPGENGDHDEDHAGHVIPAHKPRTFPNAVRRLRELNDRIASGAAQGQPATASPGEPPLNIALDIANWLPEIAAESDMPEKPWDEVNARSAAIVADYRTILAGAATDGGGKPVRDAGEAISGLEKVLAAADPKWFAVPEKRREEPDPASSASDAHDSEVSHQ
jgi:hypothetical protein